MPKVLLICQGGVSSSFVVNKVREAFKSHNEEIEINAHAAMALEDYIDNSDVVLVAPNVMYMFEDIKAVCEPHGLSPVTIPTQYYGRMDGEAIRKLILDKSQ